MLVFIIRKVDATFSAVIEFKIVTAILFITFAFTQASLLFLSETLFVILGYFEYIMIFASIACLYITAI